MVGGARGLVEVGERGERIIAVVTLRTLAGDTAGVLEPTILPLRPPSDDHPFLLNHLHALVRPVSGFMSPDAAEVSLGVLWGYLRTAVDRGHLAVVSAPRQQWRAFAVTALLPTLVSSAATTASVAPVAGTSLASPVPQTPSPAPASSAPAPVLPAPTVQKAWITIHLLGDDDQPYAEKNYSLILPNGRALAGDLGKSDKSNEIGKLTQKEIEPGTCDFTFLKLDHAAWSTVSGGGAENLAIVGGSAKEHVIAEGDSTSSVASKYGFDPATIWADPDNAALKQLRAHPNLLLPGDSLAIPARKRKTIGLATDQIHTFKRKGTRTLVAVQVFDGDKARANQEWKLEVGDQSSNGTSDGDGVVEVWVAPTDRTGTLTIGTDKLQLQLNFDRLHPASESSGVQQRLASLGFWVELPDQDQAERLVAAILSFQVRVGLDPTGKIDDATRTKLVDLHDKRGDLPPEPAIKHKA